MLNTFDLKLEGRHHLGIDDAYDIACVTIELIKPGVKFDKNASSTVPQA
jgi:hypothetical protein